MVAMSDFSTFSQITYDVAVKSAVMQRSEGRAWDAATYWDAVCVLLADTLSLRLTLLERVLVLKLGAHDV